MFAILYVFSSLSTILHNMSKISNQKFNAQLIYVPWFFSEHFIRELISQYFSLTNFV